MNINKAFLAIALMTVASFCYAQKYGNFAGGFADSFNKSMANSANNQAVEQAVLQQRINNRNQFGTKEIQRLDALEKRSDDRLREIFTELVKPKGI